MKNLNSSQKLIYSLSMALLASACAKGSGTSASIPLIEPPVSRATPSGLTTGTSLMSKLQSSGVSILALDTSEIKSRFYSAGPTKIENLLDSVDTRLSEINTRSSESTRDCLSATPVEQTMSVLGESKTIYLQCYDTFSDATGGMVFGKKNDIWYIYQNVGAGRSLAIVTPVTGSSGEYTVEAWFSVGQSNTGNWYSGSYGVIHLLANSATKHLEMTVAGTGFGYCGAQLNTDGTNLFVKGSAGGGTSDGTTWTCSAFDEKCALASDLAQTGTCTSVDATSFQLTSLGVTSQSTFGTGVTLNGETSDSVHFGYAVSELSAISGVSKF